MEDYKYTPLNLEKPAIRLLCLHPGKGRIIACELFQAELHQRESTVSYEALSYTWGPSRLSVIIHVNGCCLSITRNLYNALLDLRYPKKQRILWIDAVCINQGNDKERGHQVGQMGNIYKEADSVIFRLGWGSYLTDLFMESLQRLQKQSIQHAYRAWSRQDSRWEGLWIRSFQPVLEEHDADLANLRQGLREILEQQWFRRVWILQEVAFAKAGIISCGKKTVSARLFGLTPLLLGITPDAHCQSVLDIMPSPCRESTWWNESRSFYNLLSNFGSSGATDSRDLVYALRGISSDLADKRNDPLFPDYYKVQEDLVDYVIQYVYEFDVTYILKEAPRFSSIRQLVGDLSRLETNICKYFAEMSQPDDMERILERTEMLVTKDMMKAAAQYDKEGKVVNVLLRCRRGEFKIDDEILLCAAANLKAAKEVFEAFWCHQDQLIITEQILVVTAENRDSGPSAMRFLLSLKIQKYRIAPILAAVAGNTSENSRRRIIRILLQQKDTKNTISEILAAAANIPSYSSREEIYRILLQKKDNKNITSEILAAAANISSYYSREEIFKIVIEEKANSNDTIPEVVTAAANFQPYHLKDEIIKILLEQKDYGNDTISEILTVAADVQCYHAKADIIKILLDQRDNSNDTISKILTVAAGIHIHGPYILEIFVRKNPDFEISRDAVSIAMRNSWGDRVSLQLLIRYFPPLKEFA